MTTPPLSDSAVNLSPGMSPSLTAEFAEATELDLELDVAHVRQNLRHSSARGGALMIVSHAVQLLIGVAGTAVLARLLRPQDFGYLAMVATLTNFVATFRDFGLPMAAVQRPQLTHEQASGLFWINTVVGLGVAALVAALSPALAAFYGEPRLRAITLVMSAGILVHSLSMLHVGLLRRRMNFTAITILEVGAMVAGVVVGIGAALAGAGYWALVYQQLSIYVTQAGGAVLLCRWRPASPRRSAKLADESVRSMVKYGKDVSAARIVGYVGRNMDAILVGYFAGPAVLGLYQKAYQWSLVPFWQIYNPLLPVAVSSFSRLQGEPERYRAYFRTTLLGLFSATLPATMLLLLEAEPVILLLLGQQWTEAIPIFRILAVGAYFHGFSLVTKWLYLAEGRTGEQLRWALIAAPTTIAAVAVGVRWGAVGVALGFASAVVLLSIPSIWYCLRRSPLRARDLIGAAWRPCAASLAAAGALLAIRAATPPFFTHAVPQLILESALYLLLYAAFALLLPGGRAEARRVLTHLRLLLPT